MGRTASKRLRLKRTCSVVAAVVLAAAAGAADVEDARTALQRLDYDGAADVLRHLAADGDARAKAALAALIESSGLEGDAAETPLDLLREAADSGVAAAAFELGNRHYLGRGVARDPDLAVAWWQRAADAGSQRAAYNLGLASARGLGVGADPAAARTWFERAANGGIAEAWFALGLLKLDDTDDAAACDSFRNAADGGLGIASYNLGVLYERGVSCDHDPERALGAYRAAAAAGVTRAATALERLGATVTQASAIARPIRGPEWVRRQDPAHYTLQVANGSSEAAIIGILEHYDADVDRAYFSVRTEGNVRYVALVGAYDSYLAALNYLNTLAPPLTSTKPWIRRFGSVHTLAPE